MMVLMLLQMMTKRRAQKMAVKRSQIILMPVKMNQISVKMKWVAVKNRVKTGLTWKEKQQRLIEMLLTLMMIALIERKRKDLVAVVDMMTEKAPNTNLPTNLHTNLLIKINIPPQSISHLINHLVKTKIADTQVAVVASIEILINVNVMIQGIVETIRKANVDNGA